MGDKTRAFATVDRFEAVKRPLDDSLVLALFVKFKARIAAIAGDKNLAFEQLAISAQKPAGVSYGNLKFDPLWDSLRGDPRFEKIVVSLAPKESAAAAK